MERPRILRLLASGVLALVVVLAGFASGLVVGVVAEEPGLLMAHLGDQGEVVELAAANPLSEPKPLVDVPEVAAAPPAPLRASSRAPEPPAELPPRDPAVAPLASQEAAEPRPAEPAPQREPEPPQAATQAPPARPAPEAAPAPTSRVHYAVQVGAFESAGAAESLAAKLRGKGYPVQIAASTGERSKRWRVRVGPLDSRHEADRRAEDLAGREQLPTWVLELQ